jgi:hypothetical protein
VTFLPAPLPRRWSTRRRQSFQSSAQTVRAVVVAPTFTHATVLPVETAKQVAARVDLPKLVARMLAGLEGIGPHPDHSQERQQVATLAVNIILNCVDGGIKMSRYSQGC